MVRRDSTKIKKIKDYKTMVVPVLSYLCKLWTTKKQESKISETSLGNFMKGSGNFMKALMF